MAKKTRKTDHPLRLEFVPAGDLKDNPKNWRRHPESQTKAFRALLDEVGFIGYCVLNETTGHLLDGHMRKDAVPPETLVPVIVGKWTEQQEKLILATYNPIAGMAEIDTVAAEQLLAKIDSEAPAIQALLEVLEREVERANKPPRKVKEAGGDSEGGGGGGDEPREVKVQPQSGLMIKCVDEPDQQILVHELQAAGYTAKVVGG